MRRATPAQLLLLGHAPIQCPKGEKNPPAPPRERHPPPPRHERANKSSPKFRARRAAVLRCRIAIPPCGSPLIKITKSVSLPVSMLGPSSEMISDEPGKTTSEIREAASPGTTSRSSAG